MHGPLHIKRSNTLTKHITKLFSPVGGILPRTLDQISVFASSIIPLQDMYIAENYDTQVVRQTLYGKATATGTCHHMTASSQQRHSLVSSSGFSVAKYLHTDVKVFLWLTQ